MIKLVSVKQNETGTDRRTTILDGAPEFDAVFQKARTLMLDGASHVTIVAQGVNLTLVNHNDFDGHLVIGRPKPNPKSWGIGAWGPKIKNYGNNVQVKTLWDEDRGEFRSAAIYAKRVLNELHADSLTEAEENHALLCTTYRKTTPSNLKDEVQGCPFWRGP